MSEQESIIEIQKPKFSKLAILAMIFALLSVILYYVGANFGMSILPWVYGVSSSQFYRVRSHLRTANDIHGHLTMGAPILLWGISVASCCLSQEVIKRSKGKLRGKWLALGAAVVSTGQLAWAFYRL